MDNVCARIFQYLILDPNHVNDGHTHTRLLHENCCAALNEWKLVFGKALSQRHTSVSFVRRQINKKFQFPKNIAKKAVVYRGTLHIVDDNCECELNSRIYCRLFSIGKNKWLELRSFSFLLLITMFFFFFSFDDSTVYLRHNITKVERNRMIETSNAIYSHISNTELHCALCATTYKLWGTTYSTMYDSISLSVACW